MSDVEDKEQRRQKECKEDEAARRKGQGMEKRADAISIRRKIKHVRALFSLSNLNIFRIFSSFCCPFLRRLSGGPIKIL